MTSDERRLTAKEWDAERRRRECASWGHLWDVIAAGDRPVMIRCSTCSVAYKVVSND